VPIRIRWEYWLARAVRGRAAEALGAEGSAEYRAEQSDAVDRAGILALRALKSLQPARQLIRSVRRHGKPARRSGHYE
jgi:hypothetical protein